MPLRIPKSWHPTAFAGPAKKLNSCSTCCQCCSTSFCYAVNFGCRCSRHRKCSNATAHEATATTSRNKEPATATNSTSKSFRGSPVTKAARYPTVSWSPTQHCIKQLTRCDALQGITEKWKKTKASCPAQQSFIQRVRRAETQLVSLYSARELQYIEYIYVYRISSL